MHAKCQETQQVQRTLIKHRSLHLNRMLQISVKANN